MVVAVTPVMVAPPLVPWKTGRQFGMMKFVLGLSVRGPISLPVLGSHLLRSAAAATVVFGPAPATEPRAEELPPPTPVVDAPPVPIAPPVVVAPPPGLAPPVVEAPAPPALPAALTSPDPCWPEPANRPRG